MTKPNLSERILRGVLHHSDRATTEPSRVVSDAEQRALVQLLAAVDAYAAIDRKHQPAAEPHALSLPQLASLAGTTSDLQTALALWHEVFGLIVCRNRSPSDLAKVQAFWSIMNKLTGLSAPGASDAP